MGKKRARFREPASQKNQPKLFGQFDIDLLHHRVLLGSVAGDGGERADGVDHVLAFAHLSEHRVLSVQERLALEADEKLGAGAVRVLGAGH